MQMVLQRNEKERFVISAVARNQRRGLYFGCLILVSEMPLYSHGGRHVLEQLRRPLSDHAIIKKE